MVEFRLINGYRNTNHNSKLTIPNTIAESIIPIINEQRKLFFDKRITEAKEIYDLRENEITDLWRLFLAGEHPEYTNGKILELLPEIIENKESAISNEISWCFHNFKWIWSLIWKEYQLENFPRLCARFVLKDEQEEKHLAQHPSAENILTAEIVPAFQKISNGFELPKTLYEFDIIAERSSDNIYELDITAATVLEKLNNTYQGDYAPKMIDFLRTAYKRYTIKERVRSWKKPLFLHNIVATIVWNDWAKKRVELIIKKPPALPLLTLDLVRKPMVRGTTYNKETNELMDSNGNPITKIGREHPLDIPSLELTTVEKILQKGNVKELSTINAHRLLRWEITTVTRQLIDGNPDMRALRIEGGFSELAKIIGAGSGRKSAEQVREIVIWQANTILDTPGEQGNMLSYSIRSSGYKTKGLLTLVLGEMMLPYYVYQLLGIARKKVEGRQLIPIVDLPPLVGRPADHGPQANFQMEIMVKFRRNAVELVREGGIYLPEQELNLLARNSGLPIKILNKVMDRWIHDGDDAPAFLEKIEKDRYNLGKNYSDAQDFIISAGKTSIRKSKAAKTAKLDKKFKKK